MAKQHPIAEVPENKGKWAHDKDDSTTYYRKNGHRVTLGDGARCDRYRTPGRILATLKAKRTKPSKMMPPVEQFSPEHVKRYYFDFIASFIKGRRKGQLIPNFYGAGAPYPNEAHHLIPKEKFKALFPQRERDMLQRVDYNVHNGRNIIFLPKFSTGCSFHDLPYHSGPHKDYDDQVQDDAKELSQQLRRLPDPCKEETLVNIRAQLMALQEKYWDCLSNAGPIAVRAVSLKVEAP